MKAGLSAAFANAATRRDPTTGEVSGGFECGPADMALFNELVYRSTQLGVELTALLAAAGITPSDGTLTQVLQAVRSQAPNFITGTAGSANALTIALSPAPANWAALVGVPLRVVIGTTNTGAATLNPNGLGTKPIVRAGGSALSAGDLAAGAIVEMVYDGTNVQAVSLQSSFAPSSSSVVYASAGTSTFTVPAGIFRLKRIRAWGSGGGGGGSQGSSGGGGGGGGAGYAESAGVAVTPGQTISVVIGAGGTGGNGTPTNGGAGGTTSVGSLISIPGGSGGTAGANVVGTAGGTGSTPTGGNLINVTGTSGGTGFTLGSGGAPVGGVGGTSPFGGSVPGINVQAAGSGGIFPGGGANGGSFGSGGGAGSVGCVIIEY